MIAGNAHQFHRSYVGQLINHINQDLRSVLENGLEISAVVLGMLVRSSGSIKTGVEKILPHGEHNFLKIPVSVIGLESGKGRNHPLTGFFQVKPRSPCNVLIGEPTKM